MESFWRIWSLCPGTLCRSPSWWRVEVLRRFGFVLNDCQLTGVSCAAPPLARPSTGCVAGAKSSQSPTVSRAASHPSYLSLQRTQNDWILGQEDLEGNVWSFITRVLAVFYIINIKDVFSLNTSLKTGRVLGGDCEVSQTDITHHSQQLLLSNINYDDFGYYIVNNQLQLEGTLLKRTNIKYT